MATEPFIKPEVARGRVASRGQPSILSGSAHRARRLGYYGLLIALVAVYLVPLSWMISTSLRTQVNLFDPGQWVPSPATLDHYGNLFQYLPDYGRYVWNTLRIAGLTTVGQLVSCSMAGYALARLRFPGRNVLFVVLLLTLMVPFHATLIPVYILFKNLGWINTPLALIVPAFFGNALFTFFFRQFFMTVPRELEEAARIDGAGWARIFRSIIVPVSKPAYTAVGLLTFVTAWNSFFVNTVFLQTQDQWVLTEALQSLIGQYNSQYGEIMAGVVLMSLPIVALYAVVQRYFVEGFTFAGITG